jgi:hypothetical protein
MTEAEWLVSTDPIAMLRMVPAGQAARKRVLLVCGAWQQIGPLLPETPSLQALTALEQLAEDAANVPREQVMRLALAIEEPLWSRVWQEDGQFQPTWTPETAALALTVLVCTVALGFGDEYFATEDEAARAAEKVLDDGVAVLAAWQQRLAQLAALVKDAFGPLLFRRVEAVPTWAAWNGGAISKLAQAIYGGRAFDRLSVLADALEEVGCTNAEILKHCRHPAMHARGCWVLDLLLGRG